MLCGDDLFASSVVEVMTGRGRKIIRRSSVFYTDAVTATNEGACVDV